MSSLPNATFGSPANSFYAPYDQAASNWYNFSSLSGKIYLQDSNGVQVLQAIGGDLFFNNELLAKAGDIQLIDEWALYPAVSTVYMNQQSTLGVSLLQADTLSTASLLATTATISGVAEAGTLATVPGPYAPGDVKTTTVTASGAISGGSVSATGAVSGGSLATSGGLNMNNTAISAVSAVNISAFGMGPYGQLTSPDGSNLTWNGGTIITGGGGAASNWSVYPATQAVNINNKGLTNVSTLTGVSAINGTTYAPTQQWAGYFASGDVVLDGHTLYGGTNSDLNLASQACNVNITSYYNTNVNATDVGITADAGASVTNTPFINVTAKNGPLGGNIELNANGGYLGQAGYGKISLNAYGTAGVVPAGGLIELNAYSGINTTLLGLTSAIRQTAASIGLSAGALPSIPALAGGLVLYGNDLVSVTAGLPAVLPQVPGTLYDYGVTGVTVESPGYIDLRSPGTYTQHIYPSDSGSNLIISGRTLPTAGVELQDVVKINMVIGNGGQITACSSINYMNFEDNSISNVSTLQVSTINGFAFPQPNANVSLWADFPSLSTVNNNGLGIVGVSTLMDVSSINGVQYPPPASAVSDWATFPAVQDVNLAEHNLLNVSSVVGTGTMYVSSSTIELQPGPGGIILDSGSNVTVNTYLNLVANGQIILDTNGLGSISHIGGGTKIGSVATPEDLTVYGTTSALNTVDLSGHDVINVVNIDGLAATPLTLNSSSDIALEAANDAYVEAQAGSANLNGHIDVNLDANTGAVNLTGATGIQLNSATTIGTALANKNLTVNGTVDATGDVVSGFGGSNPYSLNTIGGLVKGNQQYNYWVAVNGSDSTGTGSVVAPFATISGALAATNSVADGIPVNICVAPGTYTENPTIVRNNTFIIGPAGVSDVILVGTLTLNPGATAGTLVSMGASFLSIVGSVVGTDTTNVEVGWFLTNVNVTSYGVAAVACTGDTVNNCSITMNNCILTQNATTNACLLLTSCRANLVLVAMSQTTTAPCVSFVGNASIEANGATFTSAGGATASPIIFFAGTIAAGSLNTFTSCSFIYSASTVGVGKTGISFANAVATNAIINYCVFSVGGSTNIIAKSGIGTTNVQWGDNTCTSVATVPATSATLTYTYSVATFIRANTLRDSANAAGTGGQVLTAGSAGGSLTWSSLGPTSLGALTATPAATAYQNSLVMFNTTTNALSYDTPAYGFQVTAISGVSLALNPAQRGRTFILTSAAGGGSQAIAVGPTFGLNDTNFFCRFKNGNGSSGGDITLNGVAGNNVIHNQTALQNGQEIVVIYDGTRFVGY